MKTMSGKINSNADRPLISTPRENRDGKCRRRKKSELANHLASQRPLRVADGVMPVNGCRVVTVLTPPQKSPDRPANREPWIKRCWVNLRKSFFRIIAGLRKALCDHPLGVREYRQRMSWIPSRAKFEAIFDRSADAESRCRALEGNTMLHLSWTLREIKKYPLVTDNQDIVKLRKRLMGNMLGGIGESSSANLRKIKFLQLTAHPTKACLLPPAMRRALSDHQLYYALEYLNEICRNEKAFSLIVTQRE